MIVVSLGSHIRLRLLAIACDNAQWFHKLLANQQGSHSESQSTRKHEQQQELNQEPEHTLEDYRVSNREARDDSICVENANTEAGNLLTHWFDHVFVRLLDGKVLIAGDRTRYNGDQSITNSAEPYDPNKKSWLMGDQMKYPRQNPLGQEAIQHEDGTILVTGGDTIGTSEIYSPASE